MGEEKAEREREQAGGECQAKHEGCSFTQCGAECAGDFKQRKQDEQADGKMYSDRMKATEELLPIGVWLSVEFDEPWQQDERRAQCQRGGPGKTRRSAFWQEPVGEGCESSGISDWVPLVDLAFPRGLKPSLIFCRYRHNASRALLQIPRESSAKRVTIRGWSSNLSKRLPVRKINLSFFTQAGPSRHLRGRVR